jgi:hypothetical protein
MSNNMAKMGRASSFFYIYMGQQLRLARPGYKLFHANLELYTDPRMLNLECSLAVC